eukprot:COSAG02_NODE_4422_length_5376_cov_220.147243_6_plen_98_part_00
MPGGLFWADMKAFELRRLAEEGYTVLQPVASTEQHGPGLPTGVDTLLCLLLLRSTDGNSLQFQIADLRSSRILVLGGVVRRCSPSRHLDLLLGVASC